MFLSIICHDALIIPNKGAREPAKLRIFDFEMLNFCVYDTVMRFHSIAGIPSLSIILSGAKSRIADMPRKDFSPAAQN